MSEKSFSSNYDLYKVFFYVAEYKSLTKAAAELGVTQPAVSQSVKQLENILGVKLTLRTGHGIKLTEEGEKIFPYVKSGCEAFAACEEILRISKNTSKPVKTLPKPAKTTAKPVKDTSNPVKLQQKPLQKAAPLPTKVKDCFVTGTQYRHFSCQKLPYRLLEHLPILLPDRNDALRQNLDAYLKTLGVKIYPDKEYNDYADLLDGAIRNQGIACLPRSFAEDAINSGKIYLLEFESEIPERLE